MPKKWKITSSFAEASADKENKAIKDNSDVNPVILQLLTNRGFSLKQIQQFLKPDYQEDLHDSFLFKDMQAVVELIQKHLAKKSKIIIYGDYDADGVTATAVMYKTLEFLGCKNLDIYIPHRESEGYGINKNAIEEISKNEVNLIITVDTGIRSIDEIALIKEKGIDVILTDHHPSGEQVPDCLIINPNINPVKSRKSGNFTKSEIISQGKEQYPFKYLAGVGVAFKVAQALLSVIASPPAGEAGEAKQSRDVQDDGIASPTVRNDSAQAFEKWLLDLVAIGTIADLMPLVNENRVLVNYGLVVLNKTQRVGIEKLIEVAQSNVDSKGNAREIDAWQVGFQLAPRLNAAGRLGHANTAYKLLITEDETEATKIATKLNNTNKERQNVTQEIFEQVDKEIKKDDKILFAVQPGIDCHCEAEGRGNPVGAETSKDSRDRFASPASPAGGLAMTIWPSGVMGLVAGKLTEKYYRPSLAITNKEGDNGLETVGSARSIAEFDIAGMLEECTELLSHYGGHKQAAGFTVKAGKLDEFLKKAKKITEDKLKDIELIPTLEIDMEVNLQDVDEELYNILQKLRPFGMGNAQPKFVSKNLEIIDTKLMGSEKQHIKLKVESRKLKVVGKSKVIDVIGFSVPDEWKDIKVGDKIDLVYYIDMNEWNGRREMQLKIIDLKVK